MNTKTNLDLLQNCRLNLEHAIVNFNYAAEDYTELMNRFEAAMEFVSIVNEFLECDDEDLPLLREEFKKGLEIE